MSDFTTSEINERIEELIKDGTFGAGFSFRKFQKETILNICHSFLNGNDDDEKILIDAPTGSGKSIISMVSSKVLETFDLEGYILTSELTLQNQYAKDFRKLGLKWGNVMGIDNYMCHVNGERHSLGECRVRNMSTFQAKKLDCYSTCGYFQAREKAMASPVSLLNYSYWLLQMNYVSDKLGDEAPFKPRDFVFFDEAHQINKIVQNHFAPKISYRIVDKAERLVQHLEDIDMTVPLSYNRSKLNNIIKGLLEEENKEQAFYILKELETLSKNFVTLYPKLKDIIKEKFPVSKNPEPQYMKATKLLEYFKDLHCKIEDYVFIINELGFSKLVKVPETTESCTYKCLEERYMVKRFLLERSRNKVFMSATFGNPVTYMKNSSLEDAKLIKLENQFNFEKSPIYVSKKYKMNYAQRDQNFPKIVKIFDHISSTVHKDQKGLVHTSSHDLAEKLKKESALKDRIIFYRDSKQKKEALQKHKSSKNGIIIGPSLLEGLDFANDEARFQFFIKLPFPSLADPFIKAKMNESQEWYNFQTAINILQGTGRAIRNLEDYATTYILDASFETFLKYNSKMLPKWFKDRIKY
jgi:ATP-dependent DNA helicase DinG